MFRRASRTLSKQRFSSYSYQESNPWTWAIKGAKAASFALVAGVSFAYVSDSRAAIYPLIVMPLMHQLSPEDAHRISIKLAKWGISPRDTAKYDEKELETNIWGKIISNPIGLAAGYDKHAEAIDSLLDLGFGLVEIGSVTPQPQKGNALPRFFRLSKDQAVINRYGFNSDGHDTVGQRLRERLNKYLSWNPSTANNQDKARNSLQEKKLLGVNLGKNKTSPAESHADYIDGIAALGEFADYIVINISSPNTPGLRALQRRAPIEELLNLAKEKRDKVLSHKPPLVVKIAPDCSDQELEDIAAVVESVGIDGIIISNTTISRPASLVSDPEKVKETGGLSGVPLKPLSLKTVSKFYELTQGKIPIIGCGGISNAQDCIEFAKAGASLVQIYTALGYKGPGLIADIKKELANTLKSQGKTWSEIVGSNHRK